MKATILFLCLALASCQTQKPPLQTADAQGRYIRTPEQTQAEQHAAATVTLFSKPIER